MRDSNAAIAGVRNGDDTAQHTEARAPSRLLVGLRPLPGQLAAGRLARIPHFGRRFPWTRSLLDHTAPGVIVHIVGAPVFGWHDYLAWRICARSRLLVRRRRRFQPLDAGRLAGIPHFGWGSPWTCSLLDHTAPGVIVHMVGATISGWHGYLAWRICARRQDCLSGVGGGSSRLPPGGLFEGHLLGGAFLGPVPRWTTAPGPTTSCNLLVYPSLDGMAASLGVARAPSRLLAGSGSLLGSLPPGGLFDGHFLGGAFLGPVPRWMTPSVGILCVPQVRSSSDGMITSLGAFARTVKASCQASA